MAHHKTKALTLKATQEYNTEIPCITCILKTSDNKHYCLVTPIRLTAVLGYARGL